MSIIRRVIPRSNLGRMLAMTRAKMKKATTGVAHILITPATATRLDDEFTTYKGLMDAESSTLAVQIGATSQKVQSQVLAKLYITDYFKVLNLAMGRPDDVFLPAHRTFYQLDASSSNVPDLSTEDLVLLWGQRVIDGEAARVAAGGTPMSNPSVAKVQTRYFAFVNALTAQSTAKDNHDRALEAVNEENEEVDKLILRICNEVETALDDHEASTRRNRAREWGVVYVSDIVNLIKLTVKDAATAALLPGTVTYAETGDTFQFDAATAVELKCKIDGSVTLHVEADGYVPQDVEVVFEGAVHEYAVTVQMVGVVVDPDAG